MDDFFSHDDQYAISYELICLFDFIIKNNPKQLEALIDLSIKTGLYEEIKSKKIQKQAYIDNNIHDIILDFFDFLEHAIHNSLAKKRSKVINDKKIIPQLHHIDISVCNQSLISSSIEEAADKTEKNPQLSVKDQALKDLLANWKPGKKRILS